MKGALRLADPFLFQEMHCTEGGLEGYRVASMASSNPRAIKSESAVLEV